MRHLAEHAAVRRCDTLDRSIRAVDIPLLVHGDIAERIAVLGGDLTICKQSVDPVLRSYETALAVGSRVDIDTAKLRKLKSRGLIRHDLRVDHV